MLDGAVLLVGLECINDTSAVKVDSTKADANGWQYSGDSETDGVSGGQVGGGAFEIYGLGFKETATEVCVAFNSKLALTGFADPNAPDGNIGWGDLFIDLDPATDFKTSSADRTLFGVRFSGTNDSGAPSVGAYKNVNAKSVTSTNRGFSNFAAYVKWVTDHAGSPSVGDLGFPQTYYSDDISLNVINEGTLLGTITNLDESELIAKGYTPSKFKGTVNFGVCFAKQLIIDECGVVGGDGSSCKDCMGIACGTQKVDQCNVCGGSNDSCSDCSGVPNGTKVVDRCGVCGGDGNSCLDCAGVPNGDKVLDRCGVCGGDGTSCLDCSGTPDGGKVIDQCGVCGGDGTSCLDCAGTKDGDKVIDACGVCGGDGKTCLDCSGEPFGSATVDRCNVCNGDGQSCLDCEPFDITSQQTELDQGAKIHEKLLQNILVRLSKAAKEYAAADPAGFSETRAYVTETRKTVHTLQLSNWFLSWQMPSEGERCNNSFCVSVSNVPVLEQYRAQSEELRVIGVNSIKRLNKTLKALGKPDPKLIKRLKKKNAERHKINVELSNGVPTFSSSCD